MNASTKTGDRFWAGLSFGILVMFSLANLFILIFAVPKFGQIYQDIAPGKPLPFATILILAGRLAIFLPNISWLIICAYLLHRDSRHSILIINLATIWNFLQLGTTLVALFMPMAGGTITGMAGP